MQNVRQLLKAGRLVVANVAVADTFWRRAVGLLGRRALPPGAGLWLTPCAAVHTVGMRFSLDLIFLGRDLRVVRVARNVPANRLVRGGRGAHSALEIAAGWLPADALHPGDPLTWSGGLELPRRKTCQPQPGPSAGG